MKAFFKFFVERHLFSSLITIMILLMGVISALRINRSVFPKIDFGMMRITTYYPGASPEDRGPPSVVESRLITWVAAARRALWAREDSIKADSRT